MTDKRTLIVGEKAWLLGSSGMLYLVEIVEARTIGDGEGEFKLDTPFTLYKVKAGSCSHYLEATVQHRSDLFAYPAERKALLEEIRECRLRLRYYEDDIRHADSDEFPLDAELGLQ